MSVDDLCESSARVHAWVGAQDLLMSNFELAELQLKYSKLTVSRAEIQQAVAATTTIYTSEPTFPSDPHPRPPTHTRPLAARVGLRYNPRRRIRSTIRALQHSRRKLIEGTTLQSIPAWQEKENATKDGNSRRCPLTALPSIFYQL